MTSLDALFTSYLDLARQLDPLRHPHGAPAEVAHRLGLFDQESALAQVAALRSIANAVEDLALDERDDEVDRTMLLDTIRADLVRLAPLTDGVAGDPLPSLRHLRHALDGLMGEDFDAASEAALRDRIAATPGFLAALRARPASLPSLIDAIVRHEGGRLEDTLDSAEERLDEATVASAREGLTGLRTWLEGLTAPDAPIGIGVEATEARLTGLVSSPLGVKGTLRVLELRRAGVERSLARSAEELQCAEPLGCAQELRATTVVGPETLDEYWEEEWRRVAREMGTLGLPVVPADPPAAPVGVQDAWSFTAHAVRDHAGRMLDAACAAHPRAVRRILVAPGLRAGWGRTVAALLRSTEVFGLPERQLMMSFHALMESVAAETDLMLQARLAAPEALAQRARELTAGSEAECELLVVAAAAHPFDAVSAALAHEAWQSWYAETGGEPVPFLLTALRGGGLAVHLSRWANGQA